MQGAATDREAVAPGPLRAGLAVVKIRGSVIMFPARRKYSVPSEQNLEHHHAER